MHTDSEQQRKLERLRRRLRHTWLVWGVAPLGIFMLLMLGMSAVEAHQTQPAEASQIQIERKFKAALALSALLFFVGFSLDGRWTDAERLGQRIYKAAGGDGMRPIRTQLAARADLAFKCIDSSVNALTAIGLVMGLIAVLTTLALQLTYGLQLLVLAIIYQVFIFSRHPYYDEVLQAAVRGELPTPEDDDDS